MGEENKRVLIVADDLTGAMDTAGPFAQRGLSTCVVAEPLACEPDTVAAARVVSLNTDSRRLPEAQAAQRLAACVARFGAQPFDIVFKKIDSTLRGNVVAETLELMRAAGRDVVLIAPAFPAQGRTVRDGMVHVNGVPLPQTEFARDALSPPPRDPLHKIFGAAVGEDKVAQWTPSSAHAHGGRKIVVADAETDDDLSIAIQGAKPQYGRMLLVGSAGLGLALAQDLAAQAAPRRSAISVTGTIVFVVGSRAVQSREQVARLGRLAGTLVLEMPNGAPSPAPALGNALQVVLLAVPDAQGGEGDAAAVAKGMARAALDVVRQTGSRALVATGGDTAIAVLEASGCAALDVMGDLMPGIPYARLTLGGKPLWLITKAGGFGAPDTLYDIAVRLRAAS